jgi:hypothetical protein
MASPLLLAMLLLALAGRPARSLYHTSDAVIKWYTEHAARSHDRLHFEELTEEGDASGVHVATISDFKAGTALSDKQTVLLVFSEHAREIITSEVALWLSQILVYESSAISVWPELLTTLRNHTSQPPDAVAATVRDWVAEFRRRFRIKIVPLANLEGRRRFEGGQLCLRKTPDGVDLNRNWPLFWQAMPASDESFGGPAPLTERQSRLVKQLAEREPPRCYVNVHSGEWAAYSPWDSKRAKPPDLPPAMPALMRDLGRVCNCKAGPAGAVSGYLAYGTSMDYMYQVGGGAGRGRAGAWQADRRAAKVVCWLAGWLAGWPAS